MAIQAQWTDDSHSLIHVTFDSEWSWTEFYSCCGAVATLLHSVSHPVDVLLDMQGSKPVPRDFMIHLRRVKHFHRNVGTTVLLHPANQNGGHAGREDYGPIVTAASVEEAERLLNARRNLRQRELSEPLSL